MKIAHEIASLEECAFWGSSLVRWPEDALGRVGVCSEDAVYLSAVGLPVGVDWLLEVCRPSLDGSLLLHLGLPVLARGGPARICLDTGTRRVVSLLGGDTPLLVNSSVALFGRFLMVYQYYRLKVISLEDGEAEALVERVYLEMFCADGECMQTPDTSYWWRMVAQMRQGDL